MNCIWRRSGFVLLLLKSCRFLAAVTAEFSFGSVATMPFPPTLPLTPPSTSRSRLCTADCRAQSVLDDPKGLHAGDEEKGGVVEKDQLSSEMPHP